MWKLEEHHSSKSNPALLRIEELRRPYRGDQRTPCFSLLYEGTEQSIRAANVYGSTHTLSRDDAVLSRYVMEERNITLPSLSSTFTPTSSLFSTSTQKYIGHAALAASAIFLCLAGVPAPLYLV